MADPTQKLKNTDFDSIEWSDRRYTLKEFLANLKLPQIACVRDGYFDIEDITTLSTGQVLTLHSVKTCRMLKGISESKKEISIPVNVDGKVEILQAKLPKIYNSVKAVSKDGPEFVLSLQSHGWLGLLANDVLKLEGRKRKNGKEDVLCCSFVEKTAENLEIPLSYKASFQSYEKSRYIKLSEIETRCKFPCTVKMHGKIPAKPNIDDPNEFLELRQFGKINLIQAYNYDKVIASIRYEEKTTVMQVPVELEITVVAALGALEKESGYEDICARVHERTQLKQLDEMDLDYVKMGNDGDAVNNIYEYIDFNYLNLKEQKKAEMSPMRPSVPTRDSSVPTRKLTVPTRKPSVPTRKPSVPTRKPSVPTRGLSVPTRDSSVPTLDPSVLTRDSSVPTRDSSVSPRDPLVHTHDPSVSPRDSSVPPSPTTDNEDHFTIPEHLEVLTVEEVADCLRALHMDVYVDKFEEEQIDGIMLVELNEEMMELSLNVSNKLHQKKLMMLIKGWRPK